MGAQLGSGIRYTLQDLLYDLTKVATFCEAPNLLIVELFYENPCLEPVYLPTINIY